MIVNFMMRFCSDKKEKFSENTFGKNSINDIVFAPLYFSPREYFFVSRHYFLLARIHHLKAILNE